MNIIVALYENKEYRHCIREADNVSLHYFIQVPFLMDSISRL